MNILLELFYTFAKIGIFTFGGGYAMIALIEDVCVEKKGWITQEDMMNVTVIAESTPGPIAINCATFVGNKKCGFIGAVVATLGMTLPSFVIIYVISMFLDNFLEITIVAHAFLGIKVAVGILIFDAAVTMIRKMKKKLISCMILCCSFAVMILINVFAWNISSIVLMLFAAALNMGIYCVRSNMKQKGGDAK